MGVKKGRKCDLATDLTYQRRYKSNKRKYSVAQTTWKYLALFWWVVRDLQGLLDKKDLKGRAVVDAYMRGAYALKAAARPPLIAGIMEMVALGPRGLARPPV